MRIAILNNAANYLYFNVNFAKYLERFEHDVIFLNTDIFIGRQLKKHNLKVEKYDKSADLINYYNDNSDIIKYFKRLYNLTDSNKLIQKKNKEYTASLAYFKKNDFDYVLILNGAFNVETDVCKNLGMKTFFFEHAYFPKAIQMDPLGVNSNTSFSNLSYDELLRFEYSENEFKPVIDFVFIDIKYSKAERYFFRFFDSGYNSFLSQFIKRKQNLTKAKKRFVSFETETVELKEKEKYILFPLQVNSDTQIILNSKYTSMYEAIDDILPVLKKTGLKVIIKEHPMEVEPVDYTRYADNKQVFVVKKIDLDKFIENAEFIVNINSSVGMQAVAKYKKTLLLGDSFYKNSPLSVYFPEITDVDLSEVMNQIQVDKAKTDKYIMHFKNKIFLKGHFYSPDVEFFERIRNRMV